MFHCLNTSSRVSPWSPVPEDEGYLGGLFICGNKVTVTGTAEFIGIDRILPHGCEARLMFLGLGLGGLFSAGTILNYRLLADGALVSEWFGTFPMFNNADRPMPLEATVRGGARLQLILTALAGTARSVPWISGYYRRSGAPCCSNDGPKGVKCSSG